MPKRLIWLGILSLVYLAACFTTHLVLYKSTLELSSYRTMVAAISGRIHEPMARHEIDHLTSQVSLLESGGDMKSLGVRFDAKPLAFYLEPTTFDLRASLALLREGRLRGAQAKFDSLSSKIDTVYQRRLQLLATFSKVAAVIGLLLLGALVWYWRYSKGNVSREISVAEEEGEHDPQTFESYLQSVVDEEVKFIGHFAQISCKGFDIDDVPIGLKEALECIAEQFVRNSVEHGGRPAESRLLAGKAEHLSIRVTLQEQGGFWYLSVWDNGEGLDGAQILARALELGLINSTSANTLAPEQLIKLVFLKGFTTRKTATSIADNDKPLSELRLIAKRFGGAISVQNQIEQSCQFSVRFPK